MRYGNDLYSHVTDHMFELGYWVLIRVQRPKPKDRALVSSRPPQVAMKIANVSTSIKTVSSNIASVT